MYRQAFEISADDYKSKQVFDAFYADIKRNNLFAYASRIMPPPTNIFTIVVIYDGDVVPGKLEELISKHLMKFPLASLEESMWTMIAKRRKENQAKSKGSYEALDQPTHVEYRTPKLQDRETKEIVHSYDDQVEILKEEPYDQYLQHQQQARAETPAPKSTTRYKLDDRPFALRYRAYINKLASEKPDDIQLGIYREMVTTMTPYLFTSSAIRLLLHVRNDEENELPVPLDPIQIEIQHPTIIGDAPYIKAINVYNMQSEQVLKSLVKKQPELGGIERFHGIGPDRYRVETLDELFQITGIEEYSTESNTWIYPDHHQCPRGTCTKDEQGHVVPCENCTEATALITPWVRSAVLIINHEYALTPEPTPWTKEQVEYSEEGIKRVGKGKNARFIKSVNKKAFEYRLVTFDAALPPAPIATTRSEAEQEESEVKRANWHSMYSKDQIIYKRMHFEDIKRDYSGSRYRHIIEQCKQKGGGYQDEGREYTLGHKDDGSVYVTSTILPFPKYVPMLRDKPPTIRRVIDSRYYEDEKEEKQEPT